MGWREAQPGQPAGAAGAAAQEQLSIVRDFPSPKAADMPKHGKVRGHDLASISPCILPQNGPRSRRRSTLTAVLPTRAQVQLLHIAQTTRAASVCILDQHL